MLDDFLQRFLALVDGLMAHPRVRVTHLWIGPPATDAALAELAEAWGSPLPAALVGLYRQADGVQLRWIDIGDEMYDPTRDNSLHLDGPWPRLCDQRGVATGLLDLPTLADLQVRDTVGALVDGDEADEHLQRAVPFDSFSESGDAVLFFGDAADDPWISVASDHLADVDPPGALTLSRYLGDVLATWAAVERRAGGGARSLGALLRERVALDPTRLVGQRVLYVDDRRGGSLMRGRVLGLLTLAAPPRDWWYGPTLVQVSDDLGEAVHVPFSALYPADDGDGYERLHADPGALRALLRGPAAPIFAALAPVSPMTHGAGLPGGPTLSNLAWAHAALTSALAPAVAAGALIGAALTLFEHPEAGSERPFAWPRTRPRSSGRATMCLDTLAVGLLDAAVIHIGTAAPAQLASWLGPEATAQLARLLQRFKARNPLRGHDPLTDLSATCGFLFRALRGGPTALATAAHAPQTGGRLGVADLRVIGL